VTFEICVDALPDNDLPTNKKIQGRLNDRCTLQNLLKNFCSVDARSRGIVEPVFTESLSQLNDLVVTEGLNRTRNKKLTALMKASTFCGHPLSSRSTRSA